MKIRGMQSQDLTAVSQVHREAFPRQTLLKNGLHAIFKLIPGLDILLLKAMGIFLDMCNG